MRLSLILLFFTCVHSYNILVYIPKFAISHVNFMGKLADTLVEAGHNVTALISEMDAKLPDGTKKANIIRVSPGEGADHMNTHFMVEDSETDMFELDFDTYTGVVENAYHNSVSFCIQCRKLLKTQGLVDRLKNEKYDALITEAFENCGVAVMVDGRFHSTLSSRLTTIYHKYLFQLFLNTQNVPLQRVFDEIYPGTPSFSDILSHSSVVFSNTDPLVDFARPTLSNIIPIGGITVSPPDPLNEYWNGILSLRSRSVLVSFGSIAKSVLMKPVRKHALLKAFASFPDTTFIWKYENKSDDFSKLYASKVANVILTEWMPQKDILADPRLSLFISHAGMASCHEISRFGVPSLLIPIFGDQVHNAGALAHVGIAQVFRKFDMIHTERIRAAIGEMIGNEKYKTTAMRVRDQLASQPSSPVEKFVKNVEFAAQFGPSKALRPLNLQLSTIQFYGIDLILLLTGSLVLTILSALYFIKIVWSILSIVRIRKAHKIE